MSYFQWIRKIRIRPLLIELAIVLVSCAISGWLVNLVCAAYSSSDQFYAWARASEGHHFIATLGVIVVGILAYLFRKYDRHYYGLFEMFAAALSTWVVLAEPRTRLVETTTLVGAIYFFVRGLDNYVTGAKERRKLAPAAKE